MDRALRALAINRRGKNSVPNFDTVWTSNSVSIKVELGYEYTVLQDCRVGA